MSITRTGLVCLRHRKRKDKLNSRTADVDSPGFCSLTCARCFLTIVLHLRVPKLGVAPYEIHFMRLNNNLPPDFLPGYSGEPIPEPYPGIGVAMRQTIIYCRLAVTYNLQSSRHRKAASADCRCPLAKCKSATTITHYALRITHFYSPRPFLTSDL